MARWLLLDCYIDDAYAPGNFLPHFPGGEHVVVKTTSEPIPEDPTGFDAVVISGSSASVLDPPPWIPPLGGLVRRALEHDVPLLGVCFGHQLLAWAHWGEGSVRLADRPEVGWKRIAADPSALPDRLDPAFHTFVSHQDEVLPRPGMEVFARSDECAVQGFRVPQTRAWGVQFHSEMREEETEAIVRSRARRHPELAIDPDAMLQRRVDGRPVARRIFDNFARLAKTE